jgi:hypothetical protein
VLAKSRQKVGLQWRKRTIAVLKCTVVVDHVIFVLLAHVFGEAILQTSKIHKLFIQYPNNTYFSALKSS